MEQNQNLLLIHKIVYIAKLAISKNHRKILFGLFQREAAVQNMEICNKNKIMKDQLRIS